MSWRGLEDFLARARDRLDPVEGETRLPEVGDMDFLLPEEVPNVRAAGVLIPLVIRQGEPLAVLTQRPETMVRHAGQVAFPGGKVDPTDAGPVAAALREAHEEVGLPPDIVELVGRGSSYVTGSGFRVTPVVGRVTAPYTPVPEPGEVAAVFETPLSFLMDPANHQRRTGHWRGQERVYYEMPHGGYRIWGVTAGIIRNLYLTLYGDD